MAALLTPYCVYRAWVLAWSCPVVFSDNAASFAALKELTEERDRLVARRNELEEQHTVHKERCQVDMHAFIPLHAAGLQNVHNITIALLIISSGELAKQRGALVVRKNDLDESHASGNNRLSGRY